ncbi:hypothetical protein [Mycobacterium sp. D16R24]|nr:hypothetical protein [Mycobacterium sp. D16R24]
MYGGVIAGQRPAALPAVIRALALTEAQVVDHVARLASAIASQHINTAD